MIDRVPRQLAPEQLEALRVVGRQVVAQLELRNNLKRLKDSLKMRDRIEAEKERSLRELQDALAKCPHSGGTASNLSFVQKNPGHSR